MPPFLVALALCSHATNPSQAQVVGVRLAELSISESADLGVSHFTCSRVYTELLKKTNKKKTKDTNKPINRWFCWWEKCLFEDGDQRRMVCTVRATVILPMLYKPGELKISHHMTFRWMNNNNRIPRPGFTPGNKLSEKEGDNLSPLLQIILHTETPSKPLKMENANKVFGILFCYIPF